MRYVLYMLPLINSKKCGGQKKNHEKQNHEMEKGNVIATLYKMRQQSQESDNSLHRWLS